MKKLPAVSLTWRFRLCYIGLAIVPLLMTALALWGPNVTFHLAPDLGPSPSSIAAGFQALYNTAQVQQGSRTQILAMSCKRPAGDAPRDYYCYLQMQYDDASVGCLYAEITYQESKTQVPYEVKRSIDCTRPGKPLPAP